MVHHHPRLRILSLLGRLSLIYIPTSAACVANVMSQKEVEAHLMFLGSMVSQSSRELPVLFLSTLTHTNLYKGTQDTVLASVEVMQQRMGAHLDQQETPTATRKRAATIPGAALATSTTARHIHDAPDVDLGYASLRAHEKLRPGPGPAAPRVSQSPQLMPGAQIAATPHQQSRRR